MTETKLMDAVKIPNLKVITPDFQAIEAACLPEMGQHWCVWRLTDRPGKKPAKIPSNGSQFIDTQRPEQWISYGEAKGIFVESGSWDGIGYLPHADDLVVALDADDVLEPDGTGVQSAAEIIKQFERIGCYLEHSPSGRGIRGFVLGVKDGKPKTTISGHSVECYQPSAGERAQYVTVTGATWGGVKPIAVSGGQEKLEAFLDWSGLLDGEKPQSLADISSVEGWVKRNDEEVERLLLGSLNPQGKYTRIMAGDLQEYGGGESEARFALISQLAYITRDEEQIERIVRRSKLDPSKFDEKRSGHRNFLHYDIARALKTKDRNYDLDRADKSQESDRKAELAKSVRLQGKERLHGGIEDLLDSGNKLKPNMPTISELLIRDTNLLGVLWYDEFADMPKKSISLSEAFKDRCAPKTLGLLEDDDLLAVTVWIRNQWGIVPDNQNTIRDSVRRWARATPINPITDRLLGFAEKWDGVNRLDSWLVDYMRAKAEDEGKEYYLGEVGKRFLIGVVARAFRPGTQQDQMLILENPGGGEGKSAAVRILARAIDESAYLEGFSPSNNKDTLQQMRGKVLGEWGELDGFDRRESEWVKNFITRVSDTYRDPYGTFNKIFMRTISFIATANKDDYLRDLGGRRRYWPVIGRAFQAI